MDSAWLGKTVSLDCGAGLGHFQGVIDSVHLEEQTITLKKAFQNGVACKMASVTIRADHIQDLNIIDGQSAASSASTTASRKDVTARAADAKAGVSTVEVRKKQRPQVAESLMKIHSTKTGNASATSSKSSKEVAGAARVMSPKKGVADRHHDGGFHTPVSRRAAQQQQRDKDCFFGSGMTNKEIVAEEFDFEKNLALFDKRLVFQEIEKNQPDVVRLVDCNLRQPRQPGTPQHHNHQPEPKYRNDQNVLATIPAQYRQISLNKSSTSGGSLEGEYSTDAGLVVPGISSGLRDRLMLAAEARGISRERMTELVARSVSDLTIQMLGGERRLNPDNSHQVPKVVALCGPGKTGTYGLASLRHLASQGVRTVAYLPPFPMYPAGVDAELNLYKLCLKKNEHVLVHEAATDLTSHSDADLVLLALDDHEMPDQERSQPWHRAAVAWAKGHAKAGGVVALDPLSQARPELPIKASVLPGCPPLWYGGRRQSGDANTASHGKLYMANLGLPTKVYRDVGISYASPFGAKTLIPINVLKTS